MSRKLPMQTLALGTALGLSALLCQSANATVMTFPLGGTVTTFNGGALSSNISGIVPDGWFETSPTSVTLFYGISGEYIRFDNPVTFQSALLRNITGAPPADAWTLTFQDAGGTVLDTSVLTLGSVYQTYTFDVPNVSKVTFTFASGGTDQYGQGFISAWFDMSQATFTTTSVDAPEPASLAVLLIGALGVAGARRRR